MINSLMCLPLYFLIVRHLITRRYKKHDTILKQKGTNEPERKENKTMTYFQQERKVFPYCILWYDFKASSPLNDIHYNCTNDEICNKCQ